MENLKFSLEFPCEVGTRIYYLYNNEIHSGQILNFTVGYTAYANIIVEGNGYFKSIDLGNWDNLICYSMEEATTRFKSEENYIMEIDNVKRNKQDYIETCNHDDEDMKNDCFNCKRFLFPIGCMHDEETQNIK